jgi:hypothetical protein
VLTRTNTAASSRKPVCAPIKMKPPPHLQGKAESAMQAIRRINLSGGFFWQSVHLALRGKLAAVPSDQVLIPNAAVRLRTLRPLKWRCGLRDDPVAMPARTPCRQTRLVAGIAWPSLVESACPSRNASSMDLPCTDEVPKLHSRKPPVPRCWLPRRDPEPWSQEPSAGPTGRAYGRARYPYV